MIDCTCRPPEDCPTLVRSLRGGDNGAGDALFRLFDRGIAGLVGARLGRARRDEWEDCAQELRVRVFTRLDRWTGEGKFCHWLSVVVSRFVIDWSRAGRPRLSPLTTEPPAPLPDPTPERIAAIEKAAEAFPPKIREVYELKRQGMRNADIAKELGLTPGAVQVRLRTMRELLKPCLEG